MYLISLIIPIYNAENHLDTAINSIINQSIGFNNIELILVDDCSTDNTKNIIEKYAKKYKNIKTFFSNKNHGHPGFGRNIGLKKSTSKYIMFMDNDDELDREICKKFYETITHENADVVCCDTRTIDSLGETRKNITFSNGIEKENIIIIKDDNIPLFRNNSIWNKIYKKSIIDDNHITFEENNYADDLIFTSTYFLKSNKLIYLKNYFGYTWNIRSESLSHAVKKEHLKGLLDAYRHLSNIFKKENKSYLSTEILRDNIGFLILQCSYLEDSNIEFEKILKDVHDFEIENNINHITDFAINIINYFILNQHYIIAILLLKSMNQIRKFKIVKK